MRGALRVYSRVAGVVLLGLLASCGGGGGGGGGGGTEGGGPPSLIPAPPAPGAVLVADAATLRPMRDGAQWQYHGAHTPDGVSVATYYTATVSQRADAGGFRESSNNVLLEGSDEVIVSSDTGAVVVRATDPLGIGANVTMDIIELRSPVRANDQYTQFEQSDIPLGADVDGDGRLDVADVAVYSRVIGFEPVTLRELARTVNAVRVEMTARVRVVKSSDGLRLPPGSATQVSWYAPGVGVVGRSLVVRNGDGSESIEFDEKLFSWDGVTEGLGAIGPIPTRLPGQNLLPRPISAAIVGNRALIAADSMRVADPSSLTMGVADSRGTLQAVREYPGLLVNPLNTIPRLHGIDDTTAMLAMPVASPSQFGRSDLRLQRFDANGNLVGSATTVIVESDGDIASAWDGQVLWLLWHSGVDLLLRPYDLDGVPLATVQVIDSESIGALGSQRMAGGGGRVLMTWIRNDQNTAVHRYAAIQGVHSTAEVRTLGVGVGLTGPALQPAVSNGVAALQWNGPIFSTPAGMPLPETRARGVTLDAAWNPRRGFSGSLDSELLPPDLASSGLPPVLSARGDRLVVAGFVTQLQIPELFSPSDFVLASFLEPGTVPFAMASSTAPVLGNQSGTLTNIDQFGVPRLLLQWPDRALVIGDNANRTMISLFWLR